MITVTFPNPSNLIIQSVCVFALRSRKPERKTLLATTVHRRVKKIQQSLVTQSLKKALKGKLSRPTRVKNKTPTPIQITIEQILREARECQEAEI